MWGCDGCENEFLDELEKIATKNGKILKISVDCFHVSKILIDRGYEIIHTPAIASEMFDRNWIKPQ